MSPGGFEAVPNGSLTLSGEMWRRASVEDEAVAMNRFLGGMPLHVYDEDGVYRAFTICDGKGRFRFEGLGPGYYTIVSSSPRSRIELGNRFAAGSSNVRITSLQGHAFVHGRVRDTEGEKVLFVTVRIYDVYPALTVQHGQSVAIAGSYRTRALSIGEYRLAFTARGCERKEITVHVGTEDELQHDVVMRRKD
ncbi:MAG: carboxypeptidase regulatory-like domain-containing protein [bacterium]|nr:carboxypeptidase regulatory-like domain-containing protein [bacterium]